MSDEFVENLKKPSAWFRVLFMAGFVVALYVVSVVLFVLMLAQILFSLMTGADNINLRRLGAGLAHYVTQILSFLTYNSEEKPFPFAAFPLPEDSDVAVSDAYAEYSAEPAAANTPAAEPSVAEPSAAAHTAADLPPQAEPAPEPPQPPGEPVKPITAAARAASKAKTGRSRSGTAPTKPRKSSAKKPAKPAEKAAEPKNDI